MALAASALAACQAPQPAPGVAPGPGMAPAPAAPPATPEMHDAVRPHTIELGRSVDGTPLTLELFGDGDDRVLVFGGIHGCEPTSATLAARLAEELRTSPDLWRGRTIGVLSRANPDGLARRTRGNANGVDLNRNFPARNWRASPSGRPGGGARPGAGTRLGGGTKPGSGPHPASEPETRALMKAVELLRPARVVSIHSMPRGRHCNNFDGPAEGLARAMGGCNGYPVKSSIGYPTPGSFGSWVGVDQGIPTITLELPRDADDATCWRENGDALLAFIQSAAE